MVVNLYYFYVFKMKSFVWKYSKILIFYSYKNYICIWIIFFFFIMINVCIEVFKKFNVSFDV